MADSEDEAEEGPTIETAIGDIVVHAFDVEKSKVHANYRECMGFYAVWERGHGGMRDLYAKSRTFHFCDNSSHAMSEIKLINLLSGFSIEDEFDSPIEEQIAAQRRSAMISRKIVTLVAAMLLVASCGGGGMSATTSQVMPPIEPGDPPVAQPPMIDTSSSIYGEFSAARAPYVNVEGGYYALGPDVIPLFENALVIGEANGITFRSGLITDGAGATALADILREDILTWETILLWRDPPIVRFAQGTTQSQMRDVQFVLVQINKSLPRDWQIDIDYNPVSRDRGNVINGEILVEFSARETWHDVDVDEDGVLFGLAGPLTSGTTPTEIVAAWALIDPEGASEHDEYYGTIGHELLHALGRGHPLDHSRVDTVMSYAAAETANILYNLDREAVLAVYSRLDFDTTLASLASDLGPWSDTSDHFLGVMSLADSYVGFGVTLRNGLANSWAQGPYPPGKMSIADNTALSGSASWSGRLVGYSDMHQPVGGATDMTIGLETLVGDLDFTALEHWFPGQRPGAIGTGTMWGDGDLHYTVQMLDDGITFGNYSPNSDDDEGIVDGGLFGISHEGMAGVLERDDLTAAFGGQLQ